MAAAAAARGQDSVYSLKGSASREQLGYGSRGEGAPNAVNAAGGADGSASLGGSSVGGMGGGGISAVDIGAIAGAAGPDAAAAAADGQDKLDKAAAGINRAATSKGQLSASKMMTGSKVLSGSPAGASTSSSYNMAAATPKANAPQAKGGDAAQLAANAAGADPRKGGRLGAMGGSNMAGGRGGAQGGDGQQRFGSLGDLATATKYSNMAKNSVYGDSTKGAVFAAQAFDGGVPAEGVEINPDAGVLTQANAAMDRMANSLDGTPKFSTKGLDNITNQQAEAASLRSKISGKMWAMAGVGVAAAIAAQVCANIGGLWGWIGAIAAAVAGIVGMILLMFAGSNGIMDMIAKLDSPELAYGGGSGNKKTWAWVLFGVMTAVIGVSLIPGSYKAIAKGIKSAWGWLKSTLFGSGSSAGGAGGAGAGGGAGGAGAAGSSSGAGSAAGGIWV